LPSDFDIPDLGMPSGVEFGCQLVGTLEARLTIVRDQDATAAIEERYALIVDRATGA
jgi:hypothetical protein